jgi:hypothetical protein
VLPVTWVFGTKYLDVTIVLLTVLIFLSSWMQFRAVI